MSRSVFIKSVLLKCFFFKITYKMFFQTITNDFSNITSNFLDFKKMFSKFYQTLIYFS